MPVISGAKTSRLPTWMKTWWAKTIAVFTVAGAVIGVVTGALDLADRFGPSLERFITPTNTAEPSPSTSTFEDPEAAAPTPEATPEMSAERAFLSSLEPGACISTPWLYDGTASRKTEDSQVVRCDSPEAMFKVLRGVVGPDTECGFQNAYFDTDGVSMICGLFVYVPETCVQILGDTVVSVERVRCGANQANFLDTRVGKILTAGPRDECANAVLIARERDIPEVRSTTLNDPAQPTVLCYAGWQRG